jgi:hypothetical protein
MLENVCDGVSATTSMTESIGVATATTTAQ